MQEAIEFTTELMDEKTHAYAERQAEKKRKYDDLSKNNQNQQQQNKRQNTGQAYTAGNSDRKPYAGSKPLCSKCDYNHEGPCPPRCNNCKKVGHLAKDCRSRPANANNNRNNNNRGTDIQEKDKKKAKNDQNKHGMEKTKSNQSQSQKVNPDKVKSQPSASFQEDEFINPFCTRVQDLGESSLRTLINTDVHSFQPQSHDYRWTRDHPLEQVRGNPTMPVQTRRQLATDPEMCMFALTVSIVEPKNIKEAMADSAWIEACKDELISFDRLKSLETRDKPFGKMFKS
ncbi:gag-pol polyprotein [Tanacetum coccineum]